MSRNERIPGSDESNAELDSLALSKLGPDALTELNQFQDGLAFINAVRVDLEAQQRLETDAQAELTIKVGRNDGAPDSTQPMSSIARFDLRSVVGVGGFATVYVAFDPVLNRQVAVKVLRTERLQSAEVAMRFERESRIAALLSHPNIVPVFDAGVWQEQPYIVSAYCEGPSLEKWLENHSGPLNTLLAVQMVATVADAIGYAHQRGVIHRDLKPGNVLIEQPNEDGDAQDIATRLRVTDFGLAKIVEDVDQLQTVDGAIVGTPAYMSPEQADGQPVSIATDIYSMGVLLYRLLTGRLPHFGETHLQTIYAIGNEEPKSPRKLNREIDRDLEAICLKCLNKQPSSRYENAFEFSSDLERWLDGEPVNARLATSTEKAVKWCRRNPVVSAAITVTLAAIAFALFQLQTANSNYLRAQYESDKAKRNVELAQETVKQMVATISRSSQIPVTLRQELVFRAVDLQETLLSDQPQNRQIIYETAESYIALSVFHENMREFDSALEAIDKALDLLEQAPPKEGDLLEQQTANRAKMEKTGLLVLLDRHDEAMAILDLTEVETDIPFQQAQKINQMAKALHQQGKLDEAWFKFNSSRLIYESNPGNIFSKGGLADVLLYIGFVEIDMERWFDAEVTLLEAVKVFDEAGSQMPYHATFACSAGQAHRHLGMARLEIGKSDLAMQSLDRAAEIFDVIIDQDNKRPVYLEYAVEIDCLRIQWLIERGRLATALEVVKSAQSDFDRLPLPADSSSVAKEKVEQDWETVASLAKKLLRFRVQIAESEQVTQRQSEQQLEKARKMLSDGIEDLIEALELPN